MRFTHKAFLVFLSSEILSQAAPIKSPASELTPTPASITAYPIFGICSKNEDCGHPEMNKSDGDPEKPSSTPTPPATPTPTPPRSYGDYGDYGRYGNYGSYGTYMSYR